jgi:hypothetical protein
MTHRVTRAAAAAIVAAIWLAAANVHAQNYGSPGWTSPEPNYYAMPTGADGMTAAMYPSPRPTPPVIGQTYITYQPLAPQQFMYQHWNGYVTRNGGGSWTTTSVTYGHRHHLLPHPSLRNQSPGLRTPAHVGCAM